MPRSSTIERAREFQTVGIPSVFYGQGIAPALPWREKALHGYPQKSFAWTGIRFAPRYEFDINLLDLPLLDSIQRTPKIK